jgi:hypothetical protein
MLKSLKIMEGKLEDMVKVKSTQGVDDDGAYIEI